MKAVMVVMEFSFPRKERGAATYRSAGCAVGVGFPAGFSGCLGATVRCARRRAIASTATHSSHGAMSVRSALYPNALTYGFLPRCTAVNGG